MPATDPNQEWLGHVQPVGLVVAPSVLEHHTRLAHSESGSTHSEGHPATLYALAS
jgi:hypothetical protein